MTPPVISKCPNDIYATSEIGSLATPVYWRRPVATDDNERVTLLYVTHVPGENFPIGNTSVQYSYVDDSYNLAVCKFSVIVVESK